MRDIARSVDNNAWVGAGRQGAGRVGRVREGAGKFTCVHIIVSVAPRRYIQVHMQP